MLRSFIIALALLFAIPAYAGDWYGSLSTGGDQREIEDIIGSSSIHELEFRGALGYQFENWRGEIEYTYLPSQEFDRDDSLIVMGYYDFDNVGAVKPFIGLGAGVALHGIDIEGGLAQVATGVSYDLSEHITGTLTYSYRVEIDGFDEAGQAVLVGMRVAF